MFGILFDFTIKTKMPGTSYNNTLPVLSTSDLKRKERLVEHITALSVEIGIRATPDYHASLRAAQEYIVMQLKNMGYDVLLHPFLVDGKEVNSIEVSVPGKSTGKSIVIGAHYDTVPTSPGANDNASAVASLLEIAKHLKGAIPKSPLKLLFFANEEPPYFQSRYMGSYLYTASLEKDHDIAAMIALDSIGYFTQEPQSQSLPFPLSLFYPKVGNFIAFVTNKPSAHWLYYAIETFRTQAKIPSEGGIAPKWFPGVMWSDHWAFARADIPAFLITDTALYRDPTYHSKYDLIEHLHMDALTHLTTGLISMIEQLNYSESKSSSGSK